MDGIVGVTEAQKEVARAILSALGEEIFVEDENYLDMATALSGTGPAYVFLFMEALIDAGVHMGFPRRLAEQLVVQTLRGSIEYYRKAEHHPASLRNQVTSPGGTSAEALYYLEKAGFRTAISRAVGRHTSARWNWEKKNRFIFLRRIHKKILKIEFNPNYIGAQIG